MAKTVAIGIQDFAKLREKDCFYVDKTAFIREWWEREDDVTLITRPRRFGKTLNMSMLECFFSNKYENRGDLFEGLEIWREEAYRKLQGTYPVILLSFAGIKYTDYENTRSDLNSMIFGLYNKYEWLLEKPMFNAGDRGMFHEIRRNMDDSIAVKALRRLCEWLYRYYGKKCIVILDEYDTPMQEAYVYGYWEELTAYIRALFNNTFKTNPYLERAIMTGITRVSKESIFSDLNNPKIVTITSDEYATAFGFTEEEVFTSMDKQGIPAEEKENVKRWYDGFTFGKTTDIYNPWSVTMYLDERKLKPYWANTSSNSLVGKLIREGDAGLKADFERLLGMETIKKPIDEQIVFNQLDGNEEAIWSLLLATGYLKVISYESGAEILEAREPLYELSLTNLEVRGMFRRMVKDWFAPARREYNEFLKALFTDDVKGMNKFLNKVSNAVFSYFDTGAGADGNEPERFYHGFVLGMMVELSGEYVLRSNRESGYGRYDVMLYRKDLTGNGIVFEFKSYDSYDEKDLAETVAEALRQIEDKNYAAELRALGFPEENIRKYGFGFAGKEVLVQRG